MSTKNQIISILKKPDWSFVMRPIWAKYFFDNIPDGLKTETWRTEKRAFIELVQERLETSNIYISPTGVNDDDTRKEITKIIIHHSHSDGVVLTQTNSQILEQINALQLIRQYGDYFSNPDYSECGKPIYSGHYFHGKQIFIAYHCLVFPDGEVIQTLEDKYVGWHAKGNNRDSIGICLIGDFTNSRTLKPTTKQIESTKSLIKKYQNKYPNSEVFGHRELLANHTTCPGTEFLGVNGWKNQLLGLIE